MNSTQCRTVERLVSHGDEGHEAGDAESGLVLLVHRADTEEEEGSGGSHAREAEGGTVVDEIILHRGEIGCHVSWLLFTRWPRLFGPRFEQV